MMSAKKRVKILLCGLILVIFYPFIVIIRIADEDLYTIDEEMSFKVVKTNYLQHRNPPKAMDNYTPYTVGRLGLKPLRNQRALRPEMGDPINDVTSFEYTINTYKEPGSTKCRRRYRDRNPDHIMDVFVLVVSAPNHFDKRDMLRMTWLQHLPKRRGGHAFFIGRTENETVEERIRSESENFQDIIQLDITDSYANLTLKTVALLHWVTNFCPDARFILKCDDDVYVNVNNLASAVQRMNPSQRFLYGTYITEDNKPQRAPEHRHYISYDVWPWPDFPPYVFGGCYLLSRGAVEPLLAAAQTTPYVPFEDLYLIGLCARKAIVKLWSHKRMFFPRVPHEDHLDACFVRDTITWQTFSDDEMSCSYLATESYRENITECLLSSASDRITQSFIFQEVI